MFKKQLSREVNHVLKPKVFTNGCLQKSPNYSLIDRPAKSNIKFGKPNQLSMSMVVSPSGIKNSALQELKRNISKASLSGQISPSPSKRSITLDNKEFHETDDGNLMFEGDVKRLEKYFPVEGHFKIRQKIPEDQDENDALAMKYSNYEMPIVKQRILIKPHKVKLPKKKDVYGIDEFLDINPLDDYGK